MLTSAIWGPPTWELMHVIVEKIKNEKFEQCKLNLINIIKIISFNLPCINSCQLSKIFFNNLNINKINNLNDVRIFIYMFHNFINKRNNRPLFNFSNIIKNQIL